MYHNEKLIDGILMCQLVPDGAWYIMSIEKMSRRIIEQEKTIRRLENDLRHK